MTTGSIPTLTPPARVGSRISLLLVGVILIGANLRASLTAVGPVLGDIRTDLGISAVTSSILISLPLVIFAIASPFVTRIGRRFGTERTLAASLLLLVLSIVGRSLPIDGAIWVGTVLLGLAIAFMNVLLPALIKRDFADRVGPITGLYSSVQSIGAAVGAGIAVPIAGVDGSGWRNSLGIWAGLALIAFAVFLPQIRARTVHAPGGQRHPSEQFRSPWKSAIGWQVTVFMGLQSTVFYALITWLPTIEHNRGASAAEAGWHQFILQIVSIVGNIAAAALIHRLKTQRLLAAGLALLMFVGVAGELLLPSAALVWIVCMGVSAGGSIVVALSLFGLRTSHHGQASALSGMAQCIGYLLAAAGPIVVGLIHDMTGNWILPLTLLLALIAIQAVFGFLAGRARLVDSVPA